MKPSEMPGAAVRGTSAEKKVKVRGFSEKGAVSCLSTRLKAIRQFL